MKPLSGRLLSRLVLALLVVGASVLASMPRPGDGSVLATFGGLNGKIAFSTNRGDAGDFEIFVADADGSNPTNLTNNPTDDTAPSWSPDGHTIAFVRDVGGASQIFVMNANGSSQTNLTNSPPGVINAHPSWSLDGSKIAFSSDRSSGNVDIWVMDANGANPTRLTTAANVDDQPVWSPDSTRIAFSRDGADIFVMNADGGGQVNVTNGVGTINLHPDWSPDGARIAFASNRTAGNLDIWVMDANGANPTRLTTDAGIDDQPTWSPDGDSIVFTSNRDGGDFDLFTMTAGGGDQTSLPGVGVQDTEPSWQPIVSDLALSITASPNPIAVGQTLTYTITVRNLGPVLAERVVVTNTLPAGITSVLAGPSQGSCGSVVNGVFSCNLGALSVSSTATITFAFTANTAGTLVDTATVVTGGDLAPGNNSASISTTVVSPTLTPTPTLIPTPTVTLVPSRCSPRPPVEINTARLSSDRLSVAVLASAPTGTTDNRLQSIRLVGTDNAVVETASGQRTAPFTIELPDQPLAFSFTARRVAAGPFLVRLVVIDSCGEWPTFVGGGSGF
jgi:uncharacterized repeat protein (TIGR01451 family)